jgi:hypothetical protein
VAALVSELTNTTTVVTLVNTSKKGGADYDGANINCLGIESPGLRQIAVRQLSYNCSMKVQRRTNREIELFVFGEFAKVCPLGVSDCEPKEPPEPDILCRLENGKQLSIELTQVDDEKVIQKEHCEIKQSMIGAPNQSSSASYVRDCLISQIKKKLDKNYTTQHEIHLLAWAETPWPPQKWRDELTDLCQQQTRFSRIWVFNRATQSIDFDSDKIAV